MEEAKPSRRKRRISPERIAKRVRETAAKFNAALTRAGIEGLEVVTGEDTRQQELVIKEIRINKTI